MSEFEEPEMTLQWPEGRTQKLEFHLSTPLRVALDPLGPRLSVTARLGTNAGPQQVTLHLDGPTAIEALRQFRDILADVDVARLEAAIRLIRQ